MNTFPSSALVCGAVAVAAGAAGAAPVKFDTGPGATNHFYELITTPVTWTSAKAAAEAMVLNAPGDPLNGAFAHLVTIGSAQEGAFLDTLQSEGVWIGLTDNEAFGGVEFANTSGSPFPATGDTPANTAGTQRGEGWVWITGEPVVYQAWNPGEPNNFGGDEDFADFSNGAVWTDRGNTAEGALRQYIVEYSTPVPEPAVISVLLVVPLLARRRHRNNAA